MSSSFPRLAARAARVLAGVAVVLSILPPGASRADNVAQTLPFNQNWSNTGLITADDNWSLVPGIIGYLGDYLPTTTPTGVDPRTLVQDFPTVAVDVIPNQTAPNTLSNGGVAEFQITDPTIALNGSGTADAPFILLNLSTLGYSAIAVSYNLRDLDSSADNATQPVVLQYRVGNSGNFANVPGGYVADATSGPSLATLVTPVSVVLPVYAENQSLVQLRIMTTNAAGNDEWVGIDDISVTGDPHANPAGTGSASPSTLAAGQTFLLTVAANPGTLPPSTRLEVSADLSSIGGSPTQAFANSTGNTFTFTTTVAPGTNLGLKTLPVTISDAEGRSGSTFINVTVEPPAGHPVISQIYGGGGNAGATYLKDYVELFNPGTATVDLTDWTVQYASATGDFLIDNSQPLAGAIGPGEYYLVALASGGNSGADLPPANISGDLNMSASAGKVALVSNGTPLSSDCPPTDSSLIDFVGYGTGSSGANCREGAVNAPTLSNTTALLRKNLGATDTNQNGSDFLTGAPNPRRTAPIVEVGPRVQITDPRASGVHAPRDASITVTFSEKVDVTDGWLHVSCAATGPHDDATHAGGPRTFVVTPNVNFQPGETCTVTVFKDFVHDQDTDDAGLNTDTLAADYTWTFTVAEDTVPPYPPEVHLTMGNPSGAAAELDTPNNYLMEKPEFALSYNRDRGTPNWVSWHLDASWTGNLTRVDTFRPDPAVPPDWYRVQATDFFSTGFDRGHMTPNADRDADNAFSINQATFLMSNMVPQAPDNNQGPWANLENYLRTLTLPPPAANDEIYIVSGPAGIGGTGSNGGVTNTLANGQVTVPAFTWKVALVLSKADGNDVSRVSASTRTIAVIMPNTQGIRTTPNNPNDWQTYLTTVDAVEALTGYDFFANVEDAVENSIEAGMNVNNPPGAADQIVTAEEDAAKDITLNAVSPMGGPLTYAIVSNPAHGMVSGSGATQTYTPAPNFNGTDSFTFRVSGGTPTRISNTATVTVTVSPMNDEPIAFDDARNTNEDTPLVFHAAELAANDSAGPANESGQTLTVTSVAATSDTHGTIDLADGDVRYVPAPNFNGPASFTYQVCDNGISAGVADPKCDTATVSVVVTPVNDAPTAANDTKTTDEDSPLVFAAADLTANDTAGPANESGQTLTVTSVTATGDTHGAVSLAGGEVTYVSAPNFNGPASFTYQVCDNGISAGVADPKCAFATVSVAVAPVNDAPTAANDTKTTDEDSPLVFAATDLTANDTAGPASESGQTLTVTSVAATGDTHGTVSLAGGQVTYVPAANFNGPASFTYQVCDDGSSAGIADPKCAGATVAVTISPVNDAPVAAADTATTDEDTPVVINVLANDTDPDLDGLVVSNAVGAAKGSVVVIMGGPDAGKVRYTPNANANGADTFTYTVSDGHGGSATAGVSVWINPQNDPPVLTSVPSAATAPELATYTFTALASDVDSASLTFSLVGAPAGAAINATTGQFSWTPNEAQGGTGVPFAFKVRITDGTSNTDADIAITVTEVNQAPALVVGTSQTVSLGQTLTFVALGSDVDIPVQALVYGLSGAVPAGATINPATGVFTWTPTAAQSGSAYAFNVTVTDGVTSTSVAVAVNTIGTLQIERDVLDRVRILRNATHDRSDRKSLDDVIDDLSDAVQSRYWVDASHLDPRKGDKVFDENEQAVRELAKLKRECHSRIPDAVLQGFIDDLVRATRLLAETAIGDAIAAHGDRRDIAKANEDLAEGNHDAARGRPDDAIRNYESAWERAQKAVR